MFGDTQATEKVILANIDHLVSLIRKISGSENIKERQQYLQEAEALISKTNPFLLQLLEGKEKFLAPMYKQLISQKLPSSILITNDATLKNTLESLFTLPVFQKTKAN